MRITRVSFLVRFQVIMLEFRSSELQEIYIYAFYTQTSLLLWKILLNDISFILLNFCFIFLVFIFLVFISYDTRRQKFVANMAWITDVDHYPSDITFMFWDLADGKLLRLVSYLFCLHFIQTPSIVNAYNFVPSWHA